jgi:hypothetical protein
LRHAAKDGDLVDLSDALVLPLLAHLSAEREAGRCSRAEVVRCLRRLRELLAERIASVPVAQRTGPPRRVRIEELRVSGIDRFARDWVATVLERCGFGVLEPKRSGSALIASDEEATLVLTGVGERAVVEALSSARNRERVRGREAVLLAAGAVARRLTWSPSVSIVVSCATLVASLSPTPIAGNSEPLEALAPAAS